MSTIYVMDGRLIVHPSENAPKATLVACPLCDELVPEELSLSHSLFHPEPEEEEQEQLTSEPDEEGVYSVTSLGDDGS